MTSRMRFSACSVYERPGPADGFRVLVSRYWPRGVAKDRQELWLPGLGPSRELIREFKAGHLTWEEFRARYLDEFKSDEKSRYIDELRAAAAEAGADNVILMCVCRDIEHCHSGLILDMLTER